MISVAPCDARGCRFDVSAQILSLVDNCPHGRLEVLAMATFVIIAITQHLLELSKSFPDVLPFIHDVGLQALHAAVHVADLRTLTLLFALALALALDLATALRSCILL